MLGTMYLRVVLQNSFVVIVVGYR